MTTLQSVAIVILLYEPRSIKSEMPETLIISNAVIDLLCNQLCEPVPAPALSDSGLFQASSRVISLTAPSSLSPE